jgi:hypothetical protein
MNLDYLTPMSADWNTCATQNPTKGEIMTTVCHDAQIYMFDSGKLRVFAIANRSGSTLALGNDPYAVLDKKNWENAEVIPERFFILKSEVDALRGSLLIFVFDENAPTLKPFEQAQIIPLYPKKLESGQK